MFRYLQENKKVESERFQGQYPCTNTKNDDWYNTKGWKIKTHGIDHHFVTDPNGERRFVPFDLWEESGTDWFLLNIIRNYSSWVEFDIRAGHSEKKYKYGLG